MINRAPAGRSVVNVAPERSAILSGRSEEAHDTMGGVDVMGQAFSTDLPGADAPRLRYAEFAEDSLEWTSARRSRVTQSQGQNVLVATRADRTPDGHCAVCGARLRWNQRVTPAQRRCVTSNATLQAQLRCRRCGTARVWQGARGAYCHGCGHLRDVGIRDREPVRGHRGCDPHP